MNVTIPDDLLQTVGIPEEELLGEVAVMLFERERLTLAQAARLAGLDRYRFQHLLGSRGIDMGYGVEDYRQDVATLRELGRI